MIPSKIWKQIEMASIAQQTANAAAKNTKLMAYETDYFKIDFVDFLDVGLPRGKRSQKI
jgi:hypothetical protein